METEKINIIWDDWEIEELLGEGASGKVYKAKRKDMEETYSAIKIIEIPQNESEIREVEVEGMEPDEIKGYFKGFVDDLVEEITLLESLKEAKGIVGISDYKVVEKEDGIGWTIYIRMELLTGINDYTKNKEIEENDIINLGIDLCEALEYCEKLNIIHRDIKPENIFISKFGEYKLGDFGIARRLENTSSIMSKKGTYLYMPPEVYQGKEYDKTVDLYSLGLVMYKLGNNNRTPFLPPAPTPITYRDKEKALMMRMQGEKIQKPENMTQELYNIIEKMIAYNPKERYQSAKQAKEELEKLKEKTVKNMSGTVNILTHKSTTRNEFKQSTPKVELPEESKTKEDKKIGTQEDLELLQNTKIEQQEEIIDDSIKSASSKQIEQKEQSVAIKEKTENNKTKKIVPIIIILILLMVLIISIIMIFNKKKTTPVSSTILVPNLINLTQEQANAEIASKELEIEFKDTYQEGTEKGLIVYQSILANSEVEKGTKIIVFINNLDKEQVQKVIMINVVGMNIDEAMVQLLEKGLLVNKIEEYNDNIGVNIIFEQDILENQEIEQGAMITLKVSLGPVPVEQSQQPNQPTNQKNNQSNNTQQSTTSVNSQPNTSQQSQINNNTYTPPTPTWSDWVESLPAGVNYSNSNIETKTQYSYRTKETTTSTNTVLNGWTQNGIDSYTYSEWSGNKSTTSNVQPTDSDTVRVVKYIKIYRMYHYDSQRDGITPDKAGFYHSNIVEAEDFEKKYTKTSRTINGVTVYEGPACGRDYHPNATIWFLEKEDVQHIYQTRTKIPLYLYYRWSDWSAYSDSLTTANDNTEVRTRTLYRYKSK